MLRLICHRISALTANSLRVKDRDSTDMRQKKDHLRSGRNFMPGYPDADCFKLGEIHDTEKMREREQKKKTKIASVWSKGEWDVTEYNRKWMQANNEGRKTHKHAEEPLGAAHLLSERLQQGGYAGSWRSRPKYGGILTAAFLIEGNSMMLDWINRTTLPRPNSFSVHKSRSSLDYSSRPKGNGVDLHRARRRSKHME